MRFRLRSLFLLTAVVALIVSAPHWWPLDGIVGNLLPRRNSSTLWWKSDIGLVILVPHHSLDMPEGTLRAILKEGQIDIDEFLIA